MLTHKVKSLNKQKPTLIMIHGFLSDSTTFHLIEKKIIENDINVLQVDCPGHGMDKSDYDIKWDMEYIAREIKELILHYSLENVWLYGYSMGGRIALSFAMQHQDFIEGLILESASPGIEDNEERRKRAQLDKFRGEKIVDGGIEKFVEEWEQLPLFSTQDTLDNEEKKRIKKMRLSQSEVGMKKALTDYGTGNQPSYWRELTNLSLPTCLVVGDKDLKFINIAKKMNKNIKNCKMKIVEGAGHTIHVEQPEKFGTIIVDFILGG